MAGALPSVTDKMFPDLGGGPLEGKIASSWDLQCGGSKRPISIGGLFQGGHLPHLRIHMAPWSGTCPRETGFCSILRTGKNVWYTAGAQ